MDFTLNEEQQMLADLAQRFVDKEYGFEARRKLAASALGWSDENWAHLAHMGLLALNVPEEFGGMGATPVETMIVMEAFGRGLVLEPFVSSSVLGAGLIGSAGSPAQQAQLLPGIAEGSIMVALAALEPGARFDLWQVATTARAQDGGYVLDGRKGVVLDGAGADVLLVSARSEGAPDEQDGISLFLVDARASGVTARGFPTLDGRRSAEIVFDNVQLGPHALIGQAGAGFALLEETVDRGLFALCAEALGCMTQLAEMSFEYLRTRKQFGKPIGSFQALQHRAADMLSAVEQARAMVYFAASRLEGSSRVERRRALSAAKAMIGRSGRFVSQQAIQLHGGMGMTDELSVGWYAKRLTCIDMTWGNTEHHVELYGETL
ncbi:alkylation response protein AidB-like acyl-CoA dehydrogenase [Herbaspirillum rubrisubalbicans]|uniref:acyl-CoA dehydrogenase family protein n=1 Tax=Herbaspirillum rubrisubalbicans TaxID=80842 RepID=UPI00209E424C|nr:acyl-CoA dehydrogenase [Herbaspirillum rubrisubalbicans]MCP1572913.1 alkylation response protein AidB-like acyl-CoA dehydrogenase [Herbaspirillum rubrisubalbicans]